MSFKIALVSELAPGFFRCENTRPIRLGGPAGAIARHVLALPENQSEWILEGAQLARAACPEDCPADAQPWILWETPDDPPARLCRIIGSSTEFRTELILQLEPLETAEDGAWHPCGRLTGEALALAGGRLTPNAKWTWTAPKMAIGSTTILAQ